MFEALSAAPRRTARCLLSAAALVALTAAAAPAHAEPASKVYLNGVPAPVFFNDGDSFRVLGGQFEGTKARLAGYNTLETHGPVHRWGGWTYKEMYVIAKQATLFARRGTWRCTSDLKTDTYGRMLFHCPELAEALIRRGLAHAMSVARGKPADEKLLAAQREAIAGRRGIWAHGVPDFVLTSLHSTAEDADGYGTYNRLVSSADGQSIKWKHDNDYPECAEACDDGYESEDRVQAVIAALKADAGLAAVIGAYDDARLETLIRKFAMKQDLTKDLAAAEHLAPLTAALEVERLAGRIGRTGITSCHIYVDFRRRFGGGKAVCLKW